MVKTELKGTHG